MFHSGWLEPDPEGEGHPIIHVVCVAKELRHIQPLLHEQARTSEFYVGTYAGREPEGPSGVRIVAKRNLRGCAGPDVEAGNRVIHPLEVESGPPTT